MKLRASADDRAKNWAAKAREAAEAGRTILTADLPPDMPADLIVEAVEGEGWHLEHASAYWNTAGVNNRHVWLLFRRTS